MLVYVVLVHYGRVAAGFLSVQGSLEKAQAFVLKTALNDYLGSWKGEVEWKQMSGPSEEKDSFDAVWIGEVKDPPAMVTGAKSYSIYVSRVY